MLRQAELWRVLGRRLTERLLRAGWIEPVRANGSGIFYDQYAVHRALLRVQREGWLLDGHHVRDASVSKTSKVRKSSPDEVLANLSLQDL
jgi:hypothetical protein